MSWITEPLVKLIDKPAILLILLGTGVTLLGPFGGITYQGWAPLDDIGGKVAITLIGIAIFLYGAYRAFSSTPDLSPDMVKEIGIKITTPKPGDCVSPVNVEGEISKPIPRGYDLRILRIYDDGSYVPIGIGKVRPDGKNWDAPGCNIGGKPGDSRIIGACLVGEAGRILLRYYTAAANTHRSTLEMLKDSAKKTGPHLPQIPETTPDMHICDRVAVKRA